MTGEGTISDIAGPEAATDLFGLALIVALECVAMGENKPAINSPIATTVAPVIAAQRDILRRQEAVTSNPRSVIYLAPLRLRAGSHAHVQPVCRAHSVRSPVVAL
jgi:hypothetical protein